MPLYLTRKSIRELAHLSPAEREAAWRAAARKATADWQYWAALIPVLALWGGCFWLAPDLLNDWKYCGLVGCVFSKDIGSVFGFLIGMAALRLVAVSRIRHHLRARD